MDDKREWFSEVMDRVMSIVRHALAEAGPLATPSKEERDGHGRD